MFMNFVYGLLVFLAFVVVLGVTFGIVVNSFFRWFCDFFHIDIITLLKKTEPEDAMHLIVEKTVEAYNLIGFRGIRLLRELGIAEDDPRMAYFERMRDTVVDNDDDSFAIWVSSGRIKMEISVPDTISDWERKRVEKYQEFVVDHNKLIHMSGWPLTVMFYMY
jgi:hypothetical protein